MGAVSLSQQAAASVAVPQAVPQSDDPGAVMVIATPVEVSPSGSLILICIDPQHDVFMNAKQRIVHLPVVHETRTIPTLTDIMKHHGWRASPTMDNHEMELAVIETGQNKGTLWSRSRHQQESL